MAHGRSNVSIRIYDTTALIETLSTDIFHVEGYVPVETYNKCFITEILSAAYDRCVYLDSDILVMDDIQKLHDIDLKGHSIGASVNVANVNSAFCKRKSRERGLTSISRKTSVFLTTINIFRPASSYWT